MSEYEYISGLSWLSGSWVTNYTFFELLHEHILELTIFCLLVVLYINKRDIFSEFWDNNTILVWGD